MRNIDSVLSQSVLESLNSNYSEKALFRLEIEENSSIYGKIFLFLHCNDAIVGSASLYIDPTCCGAYILSNPIADKIPVLPLILTITEDYVRSESNRGFIFHTNNLMSVADAMSKAEWPIISKFYNPNSKHWVTVWGKAVRTPRDRRRRPEEIVIPLGSENARVVGLDSAS